MTGIWNHLNRLFFPRKS